MEQRPRALVVDDDEPMRLLLRKALVEAGFEVEEAEDGAGALEVFDRVSIDLVLLDVLMPRMNGFEACRAMRERHGEHVPILFMTGLDDVASIHRAYEAGGTDFITKPVNGIVLGYRARYMLRNKRALDELRRSQQRLANAQRIARLGNWELEVEPGTLSLSEEAFHIFGLEPELFQGSLDELLRRVPSDERSWVSDRIAEAVERRTKLSIEHRLILDDGSERVVNQEAEVSRRRDRTFVVGTAQDVTARKEAERKIYHLAHFDPLTGLPNRGFLQKLLEPLLRRAQRTERHVALISLDIDFFKRINDTFGHRFGDRILQEVAERLTREVRGGGTDREGRGSAEVLRGDDIVARLGGDEFMVALGDVGHADDAALVATRLKRAVAAPYAVEGREVVTTASIGISLYPDNGREVEALMRNADAALHAAKEGGKDAFQFYSEWMNARALERFSLEHALRKAIEGEELLLHYQPKVNIRTGEVMGMEALVRWRHKSLGILAPAKFIPLAEQTGLIVGLGEWVLRIALAQLKAWQNEGLPPLRVSVNVSSRQFKHHRLLGTVRKLLERTRIEPSLVEVELTEGTLMDDVDTGLEVLSALKSLGVHVALDDFGTGYSSLSYLKRFPIDTLKIDRSFVRGMTSEPDTAAIVTAIISMARHMGKTVVAEGVETREELELLREQDCDEVQGFYFSKPVPADEFARWLRLRLDESAEGAPARASGAPRSSELARPADASEVP